ncbi:MAG: hypothetical protein ACOC43_08475 [Desulfohalobiaceae bacterium]
MGLKISREWWLMLFLLLAALGLSLELVLQYWQQSGLCPSSDCAVAGQAVRLGEKGLVLAGGVFFWILLLLSFLASRRENARLWQLVLLLLLGALAFDGALLSYQLLELDLTCWLCLAVALVLLLSLGLFSLVRRATLVFCLGLAVWVGAGAANAVLVFPGQPPAVEESWVLSQEASQEQEEEIKLYLFFSLNCPHCMEVMVNLAEQAPGRASWYLCSLDQGHASLQRLAYAREKNQDQDAFSSILQAKQLEDKALLKEQDVSQDLEERVQNARDFFRARELRGVPVLLARQGSSREVLSIGVSEIAKYLWEQDLISNWKR